jgi:5-methylcytosine-specific restriction protein A
MASGGWGSSDRRTRLPASWHAQRQRILRRDQRICYVCGGPGADGVDHVRPGDEHDDANLAAIHHNAPPYCHRAKSSREGGQADGRRRRAMLAAKKRPAERHPGERHPGEI